MRIGSISVANPLVLAPMEEHTSLPLRRLMHRHGAGLVIGERLDAKDVAARDKRALKLLATAADERPCLGQISSADPGEAAAAARVVAECGFAGVDLNFECPIRRLVQRGEGGALMGQPERIAAIVSACVRAADVPVTLKIRSGPDDQHETAVEVAQRAADAGAAAVWVHARSVATAYAGPADWAVVARVKAAVAIPVGGSGGIRTAEDAISRLRSSGADAVMIGRGCLGNPWIFTRARALLSGAGVPVPSQEERGRTLLWLAEAEREFYGAVLAQRRLARVACYFAKDLPTFADFRAGIQGVRTADQLRTLVRAHFR